MAVPYDATQHIQGIAQGVQNAMPGIQDAMPGDPMLDQFINNQFDEFARRRGAGEPKENIMADLENQFKSMIANRSQVSEATKNVPTVGVTNGVAALGPPGGLNAPISKPPESFAPGISGNNMPSGMPGGMGGNVIGNTSIMNPAGNKPSPVMPPAAPIEQTPQVTQANADPSFSQATTDRTPESLQSGNVNLMARNNPMQTSSVPAPPPQIRNRGEQRRAMQSLQQMNAMQAQSAKADMSQFKLHFDMLKTMAKEGRLSEKDKADILFKLQDLIGKKEMFAAKSYLDGLIAADKIKIAKDRNNIARNRVSNGPDRTMLELWKRYKQNTDEYARYRTSMNPDDNPEEVKRLNQMRKNALKDYNDYVTSKGLPPMTAELSAAEEAEAKAIMQKAIEEAERIRAENELEE